MAQKASKKNFIKQNCKLIKKLEQDHKSQEKKKLTDEKAAEILKEQTLKRFEHVTSRVTDQSQDTVVNSEVPDNATSMVNVVKSLEGLKLNAKKPSVPTAYKKGVVPQYLIKRKEELAMQKLKEKELVEKAKLPPGCYILSEREKATAIKLLHEQYRIILDGMRRLPIATDTLRIQKERSGYENELRRLDEEIKQYSYPVVYGNFK